MGDFWGGLGAVRIAQSVLFLVPFVLTISVGTTRMLLIKGLQSLKLIPASGSEMAEKKVSSIRTRCVYFVDQR